MSSDEKGKLVLDVVITELQKLPLEEQRSATIFVLRILLESFCEASGVNGAAAIMTLAARFVKAEEMEAAFDIVRRLHKHELDGNCICSNCSPGLLNITFDPQVKGDN